MSSMIVGCDAAKNYMSLEIHNWCKWLDCDMEGAKNCKFLHSSYRCKIEQLDTRQHYGIKNSETEMCICK